MISVVNAQSLIKTRWLLWTLHGITHLIMSGNREMVVHFGLLLILFVRCKMVKLCNGTNCNRKFELVIFLSNKIWKFASGFECMNNYFSYFLWYFDFSHRQFAKQPDFEIQFAFQNYIEWKRAKCSVLNEIEWKE